MCLNGSDRRWTDCLWVGRVNKHKIIAKKRRFSSKTPAKRHSQPHTTFSTENIQPHASPSPVSQWKPRQHTQLERLFYAFSILWKWHVQLCICYTQKCIITIEIIGYMSHSVCHCLSTRLEGVFFFCCCCCCLCCAVCDSEWEKNKSVFFSAVFLLSWRLHERCFQHECRSKWNLELGLGTHTHTRCLMWNNCDGTEGMTDELWWIKCDLSVRWSSLCAICVTRKPHFADGWNESIW